MLVPETTRTLRSQICGIRNLVVVPSEDCTGVGMLCYSSTDFICSSFARHSLAFSGLFQAS
jgi:hypothetical protein